MCVLTFLPQSHQQFIITNNRDEHNSRPRAFLPETYIINNQVVTFPKDALAGGTWIATSARYTLCLLNGAFVNHQPQPPYRQSRGKVILDFFEKRGLNDFLKNYVFEGIEPFTLIVIDTREALRMTEIRWDSQQVWQAEKSVEKAHIWSSATLYSPQVIAQREDWFATWLNQYPTQNYTPEDALSFHKNGGNGDPSNDLNMKRGTTLATQCITQVRRAGGEMEIRFEEVNE